ncbi:hypothetical protein B296_00020266, partial [Ensete ventricosum]
IRFTEQAHMAGVVSLLVLLVAAAPAAAATDYTVGDLQGWVSGVDYNAWASSKTFDGSKVALVSEKLLGIDNCRGSFSDHRFICQTLIYVLVIIHPLMAKLLEMLALIVLSLGPSAEATVFTVGDSAGWDISADLASWVANKVFSVGDALSTFSILCLLLLLY